MEIETDGRGVRFDEDPEPDEDSITTDARDDDNPAMKIASGLARVFAQDNPHFDMGRFLIACGAAE